jgi:hypothetical protein
MPPSHSKPLRLKVQQIEKVCLFELSWGRGQQLSATLPYRSILTGLYQEWRRVYLSFYETAQIPLPSNLGSPADAPLRGRVAESGSIAPPPMDWQARLVETEAKLLYEFHRWLRSAELFEIRAKIAQADKELTEQGRPVDVFLTCTPIALARFPWEAWEIGTEFGSTATIRIVRTPANIRAESSRRPAARKRARILAILGDDTGLNFQMDQAAVRSLSRSADVKFVGWQPGQSSTDVKKQISRAIADEAGWDVLFFAGHSNEKPITGGELAIAPGTSIQISEIAPQLTFAKERGLQFAIFNSCSGLSIAESLIDLGLSQVAVMREPIHNRVAQEFLVRFLQNLAAHKDVHDSLLAACQFLELEKNFTYPSAYLLPSLFRHPAATLFRIEPTGWKQVVQAGLPSRVQAIAVAACLVLGALPPVQQFLLDRRVATQAAYRHLTGQVPPPTATPPVALVQIDEASIERDARIAQPNPIDQSYLADLIERLSERHATVIGIDYLLNRPDAKSGNNSERLRQSILKAVLHQGSWFVFGTLFNDFEGQGVFTTEAAGIAERTWTLQGYVAFFPDRVTLPYPQEDCRQTCPFAYLLSFIHASNQSFADHLPQPKLGHDHDLRTQLLNFVDQKMPQGDTLAFLQRSHLNPVSTFSYEVLGLVWLDPIIDFSIPPDRVYQRLAAWRVLNESVDMPSLSDQVVIIGSGGYVETGGVAEGQSDNYPVPTAMKYWRTHLPPHNYASTFPSDDSANSPPYLSAFTGPEAHAYMVHHLVNQHLVTPIPDIWMIGVAAVLGQGTVLLLKRQQYQHPWTRKRQGLYGVGLAGATVLYGVLGLQLYVSANVLLPWLLPSSLFWMYAFTALRRKVNA